MSALKAVHKNKHDYEITYFKKCRSDDQSSGAFVAEAPMQKRRRRSCIATTVSKKVTKNKKRSVKKGEKRASSSVGDTVLSEEVMIVYQCLLFVNSYCELFVCLLFCRSFVNVLFVCLSAFCELFDDC